MSIGLLGKKIGMTQVFSDDGKMVGVTAIEAGPCAILAVKEKNIERIKKGMEELTKVSHKLAEEIYKQAAAKQQKPQDYIGKVIKHIRLCTMQRKQLNYFV